MKSNFCGNYTEFLGVFSLYPPEIIKKKLPGRGVHDPFPVLSLQAVASPCHEYQPVMLEEAFPNVVIEHFKISCTFVNVKVHC